jgi:hypothetical protein
MDREAEPPEASSEEDCLLGSPNRPRRRRPRLGIVEWPDYDDQRRREGSKRRGVSLVPLGNSRGRRTTTRTRRIGEIEHPARAFYSPARVSNRPSSSSSVRNRGVGGDCDGQRISEEIKRRGVSLVPPRNSRGRRTTTTTRTIGGVRASPHCSFFGPYV